MCINHFISGKPYGLYEIYLGEHVSVLQGCGLGGGSLINANVGLDAEPAVYHKPDWPEAFMSDVENMLKTDRKHVTDMLKPTPYPDSYPALDKIERMQEGFAAFDIEDLDKHFYKTPIYVTFEDKERNHVGVPQPKCTACGNCCGGCNVGAKNTLNMNYIAEAKVYGAEIYTKVLQYTVLIIYNMHGKITQI
jgi:cholesterol oxidase